MKQIAALREEWFARLAEAIEGAQSLAWRLGTQQDASSEARELYDRLEAVRAELNSLRGLAGLEVESADSDLVRLLGFGGLFPGFD
jgi:hypothetical protein